MMEITDDTLFKVLGPGGECWYGGNGSWQVGVRRSVQGGLVPCEHGIHLCRKQDLLEWLGPAIHPVTDYSRDEVIEQDNKLVVRWAVIGPALDTWNDRTARHFACDCAELALQRDGNPDERSVTAIAVARRFADGQATEEELAAARDAAWASAAARDAAWASASAAAWDAASASAAAWAAAWTSARDAASAAARAAAMAAASASEAAGDAAMASARDAARAAAWAAAWDAASASAAARDAAWDAERKWQADRFFAYLTGATE